MVGSNKMNRYERQMAVGEFGVSGQKKIAAARALVVGAGGLASPVLQYLVGAGLGYIRLMDPDIVTAGNLHRQTLFRVGDLGLAKVMVAAKHMANLNSDCKIMPIKKQLTPDNVDAHTANMDLVIDCADSFAVSYTLSDNCLGRIPFIHASVVGMAGYVGGFCANSPSLRAVFPNLPQRFGSCAQDGVLGPIVGVIGSLQAQFILGVITGQSPSPMGQLVTYDAAANRFGGFRFDSADDPDDYLQFISPSQVQHGDLVIDLRDSSEAPLVTSNAIRAKLDTIVPELPLGNAGRVVFCCQSGQRAWTAAEKLSEFWSGPISLIAAGDPILSKKEN